MTSLETWSVVHSVLTLPAFIGLWIILFRSPLIPHLAGKLWGAGMLSEEEFEQILLARGRFKTLKLWYCSYCQATWCALLATLVMTAVAYPLWSPSPIWLSLTLLVFPSLVPFYLLTQEAYGRPSSASASQLPPAQAVPEQGVPRSLNPDRQMTVQTSSGKVARVLSKEENHILSFFLPSHVCDFPGCEDLKAEYHKQIESLGEDCPECRKSDVMRDFREKLRVIHGYDKTQVPDLF